MSPTKAPSPSIQAPEISVLMAVHNGAAHVESALRSVMDQTFRNIEIVVVDDCSTDDSPAILQLLAAEDPRIRVVTAPHNLKLAGALNLGLDHVRAPLVARMDDDDLCLPNRLAVQKRYLETHPDITLVGSNFERMDGDGHALNRTRRSRDMAAIRWALRFSPNVSHPSFMFRRQLPDGSAIRYDDDPGLELTQDFDLLCRLSYRDAQMVILPDVLLRYRVHVGSVSVSRHKQQQAEAKRLGTEFQRRTLPPAVFDALAPVRACFFYDTPATPDLIAACFAGMKTMLAHDIAQTPDRAVWLRRQSGQFLAWALRRGGATGPQVATAFLRHWPGILPAMAFRAAETKGWLPAALNSDPDVWADARGGTAA
jgi:hypothetical protein